MSHNEAEFTGAPQLGVTLGNWRRAPREDLDDLVGSLRANGYESVWGVEAYGQDAVSSAAWFSSRHGMAAGTAIMQMAARQPAMTAMTAMTMDHLTDGRFYLGLGVSGPQVVEGWYGLPYRRPLAWTREYVDIVRLVMARQAPVEYAGARYQLPLQGELGKPLKSSLHPKRPSMPILLAAEGPKNIALAAEIGDGWLPFFYSPRLFEFYDEALEQGFRARGDRPERFIRAVPLQVSVSSDFDTAAQPVREHVALYVGGMGSKEDNFHRAVFDRMGFADEAEEIQALYLEGRVQDAQAAVTREMVTATALAGTVESLRRDLRTWRFGPDDIVIASGDRDSLHALAGIVREGPKTGHEVQQ